MQKKLGCDVQFPLHLNGTRSKCLVLGVLLNTAEKPIGLSMLTQYYPLVCTILVISKWLGDSESRFDRRLLVFSSILKIGFSRAVLYFFLSVTYVNDNSAFISFSNDFFLLVTFAKYYTRLVMATCKRVVLLLPYRTWPSVFNVVRH